MAESNDQPLFTVTRPLGAEKPESNATAAMGLPKDYDEAVRQRDAWYDTAARHYDDARYYRHLLVQIGGKFGKAARTQDDGNDCGEVLPAKVFEVIALWRHDLALCLRAAERSVEEMQDPRMALENIRHAVDVLNCKGR